MSVDIHDVAAAITFLKGIGASSKLVNHVLLVGEAANLLILKLEELNISFDSEFVRLGVVFHDAGKIIYPQELIEKGNKHEAGGEKLLISKGVPSQLARCCRSHAQWNTMECCCEELIVALADKLWKGKREIDLEKEIIRRLSKLVNIKFWELFIELDLCFEMIASTGEDRLSRSLSYIYS